MFTDIPLLLHDPATDCLPRICLCGNLFTNLLPGNVLLTCHIISPIFCNFQENIASSVISDLLAMTTCSATNHHTFLELHVIFTHMVWSITAKNLVVNATSTHIGTPHRELCNWLIEYQLFSHTSKLLEVCMSHLSSHNKCWLFTLLTLKVLLGRNLYCSLVCLL
jgi:hypothetical protein